MAEVSKEVMKQPSPINQGLYLPGAVSEKVVLTPGKRLVTFKVQVVERS